MRNFFILLALLLFSTILFANTKETCYSVQLVSLAKTKDNYAFLKKRKFPDGCQILDIKNILKVRCGCFKTMELAKKTLPKFEKNYDDIFVATTYSYRFKSLKSVQKKVVKKVTAKAPVKIQHKPVPEVSSIKTKQKPISKPTVDVASPNNGICYSVRLVSLYNSKKNYDLLKSREYPSSCNLYSLENIATVRCGCYSSYSDAKMKIDNFKNSYSDAGVTSMEYKVYISK